MKIYNRSWERLDTDNAIIVENTAYFIQPDQNPPNPRKQFDPVMHLIADLGRYGDYSDSETPLKDWYEELGCPEDVDESSLQELCTYAESKGWYVAKVYAYVHGAVRFSLRPFGCPFDSGCCGVIYASPKECRKNQDVVAETEIRELDQWVNDDVWELCTAEVVNYYEKSRELYVQNVEYVYGGIYGYEAALEALKEEVENAKNI